MNAARRHVGQAGLLVAFVIAVSGCSASRTLSGSPFNRCACPICKGVQCPCRSSAAPVPALPRITPPRIIRETTPLPAANEQLLETPYAPEAMLQAPPIDAPEEMPKAPPIDEEADIHTEEPEVVQASAVMWP